MAIIKCKMCGGDLEVTPGLTVAECEYCGTKQTLPKANEEVIQNLFNRANALRLKCEFDKAEQIYEKILHQNDAESEAHWGIVLCKYGIEYVEDPKTFKRIPTCHRTSYDAVTTDADYLAALEYADAVQRGIYEGEAKAIDEIQKNILSIVKDEKPFDVFICYKETDESGKRTIDSSIANDIYYQLTQEGLKVFYAAITLEDKLGQEYEPYIFAALNSAKVMLVIGTKPQHFTAVWVKNEWSRFLKLMKSDRSKLLIPCYRDMDAYELPEEFAHLQAQDMSKIGFISDVVRGIKKVTGADEPKVATVKETVMPNGNVNSAPLLERAVMFLEDRDWDSANEYCEKVLDIDPKNAQAYLCKLMAELRVDKQERLKECAEPFDGSNYYQKTLRFADETLQVILRGYIEHINTRNENARLEGIYIKANSTMSAATTERAYKEAAQLFASIGDYLDSVALEQECSEKAENARKDAILADGKSRMTKEGLISATSNYKSAIKLFETISGWKDADEQIVICEKKIKEISAKEEADRLERKRQAEITCKEAEKREKLIKKTAIITMPIVCAIIVFVIILNTVIIPNAKYNDAIALMDAGNIVEAYEALIALDGYKDSSDKANSIYDKYKIEKMKTVKVGAYVFFGSYEQDNDKSNGQEGIEWLVLSKEGTKILVISKYTLDTKPYNTSLTEVTWETCTLRKWLNNDFINSAFSADEKAMIPATMVSADKNSKYSTNPGDATQDQVFLLSITEVNNYFGSNSVRKCKNTDYAVANGAWESGCCWWLRSPGVDQTYATGVYDTGSIIESGYDVDNNYLAVRPVMWIDLSSD